MYWDCATLAQLVDQAYADKDHPLQNSAIVRRMASSPSNAPKRVRGGPSWAESEMFTIEAKAPINVTDPALGGSTNRTLVLLPSAMSQALRTMLEDRFQLKVRRETEQQDMYALTVAKGGLNRERITSPKPGDCMTPADYSALPAEQRPQRPTLCGRAEMTMDRGQIYSSFTMRQLAELLSTSPLDRFVIDQTGIEGPFNFVLLPDRSGEGSSESFYTRALEALGLKVVPIKGPGEFIRIERAEKPRPDGPFPTDAGHANAPARAEGAGNQPDGSNGEGPRASAAQATQIVFEAVSIKPCTDFGPGTGRSGNSPRISISPGYAHFGCITLANLIDHAWGGGSFPENSLLNSPRLPPDVRPDLPKRVRGGPSWVDDERWEIEIRVSGDTSDRTGSAFHNWALTAMTPALQKMIEDRFQLKMRKATEQRPMYGMTVAQGGLKIKLTAPQKCWERPWNTPRGEPGTPPPGFEGTPACGYGASSGALRQPGSGTPAAPLPPSERRADRVINFTDINLADFANWLTRILDRSVLDRTNVEGRFSFPLEYAVDDTTPGETQSAQRSKEAFASLRAQNGLPPEPAREAVQPKGPTIFKALETLGLKLDKTTGPAEYFLIESAQRPKPNFP